MPPFQLISHRPHTSSLIQFREFSLFSLWLVCQQQGVKRNYLRVFPPLSFCTSVGSQSMLTDSFPHTSSRVSYTLSDERVGDKGKLSEHQ